MKLLLVEDDRAVRITVRDALTESGYAVTECADGARAFEALSAEPFEIVLTDVRLPGMDGIALFRATRRLCPRAAVVLMTAFADAADAVAVMREGARDYVQKPFEMDELLLRIGRVRAEVEFRARMEVGGAAQAGERLRGDSPQMAAVRERVEAAARTDAAVLLTGETGTGKDLCARTIHERSARAAKPFVAVSCAAIPELLLASELLGQPRSAFTAAGRRIGRLEAADGGTLLLDEIGELSLAGQARLLRVLETSSFRPGGASSPVEVDVRLMAATSRDLAQEVARGAFRRDLFHRLHVLDVQLPPLRERRADVPVLVRAFLEEIAARQELPIPELEPEVTGALAAYDYPGNVRELQHVLERAVALAQGGPLRLEHLPAELSSAAAHAQRTDPAVAALKPLGEAVAAFERAYIQRALDQTGGHRTRAAALLGISRKNLWERLRDETRTPPDRSDPEEPGEG